MVAGHAFTLVDVLVSMAVVTVLVGLLMPSLSVVRETTRRVACSSNVRQHGLGIAMFADENRGGNVPRTIFAANPPQPQNTIAARPPEDPTTWDGMGWLYDDGYLRAPGVFYCPSHWGEHPLDRYALVWPQPSGVVYMNYQYRGYGPNGVTRLSLMPQGMALVTDGLRTINDYNHRVGTNILRVDLAVTWFSDPAGRLADGLPADDQDAGAAGKIDTAWHLLDDPAVR